MNDQSPKKKFPRSLALIAARELCFHLMPACEVDRIIVAGSLRRRKQLVGDVEIVYVSKEICSSRSDLFRPPDIVPVVDCVLCDLISSKKLKERLNCDGNVTWGDKNKYAVHVETGIPVDLFATTEAAWFNYLVCRTGPAELNIRISQAAAARGLAWHPYRSGFTDREGNVIRVGSEREVFERAGLAYLEPWER